MGPILLLLLLLPAFKAAPEKKNCIRHLKRIYIYKNTKTYGYINAYNNLIEDLEAQHLVEKHTRDLIRENLLEASHGLCEIPFNNTRQDTSLPQNNIKREKRQIGFILGAVGSLIFGPLLANLLNPRGPSSDYTAYMKRLSDTSIKNQHIIQNLKYRITQLEDKEAAEEALIRILATTSLEAVEYRQMLELQTTNNRMLSTIMRTPLRMYQQMGTTSTTRGPKNINADFPIPRELFKIRIQTNQHKDCDKATIEILAVVAIPSSECEYLIESNKNFTLTGTNDGSCRLMGPITQSTTLSDGSSFINTNHLTKKHNCNKKDFEFHFSNATIMAHPIFGGSAVADCNGVQRATLDTNNKYAISLECAGFISNKKRPMDTDWYVDKIEVFNELGKKMDTTKHITRDNFMIFESIIKEQTKEKEAKPNTDPETLDYETMETFNLPSTWLYGSSIGLLAGFAFCALTITILCLKRHQARRSFNLNTEALNLGAKPKGNSEPNKPNIVVNNKKKEIIVLHKHRNQSGTDTNDPEWLYSNSAEARKAERQIISLKNLSTDIERCNKLMYVLNKEDEIYDAPTTCDVTSDGVYMTPTPRPASVETQL